MKYFTAVYAVKDKSIFEIVAIGREKKEKLGCGAVFPQAQTTRMTLSRIRAKQDTKIIFVFDQN